MFWVRVKSDFRKENGIEFSGRGMVQWLRYTKKRNGHGKKLSVMLFALIDINKLINYPTNAKLAIRKI